MNNMENIDSIVATTFQTIESMKEHKNGANALFLYFDYIKHSRIQWTNQPWLTDDFMIKSIWWWKQRFRDAKNTLKELWLIEIVKSRNEIWELWKVYIKINFLIWKAKREASYLTTHPETQRLDNTASGETDANAWSTSNKMLEEKKEMLEENTEDKEIQNTKLSDEWTALLEWEETFSSMMAQALVDIGWKPKISVDTFVKWVKKKMNDNRIEECEKDFYRLKSELSWFVDHYQIPAENKKIKDHKSTLWSNFCLKFKLK